MPLGEPPDENTGSDSTGLTDDELNEFIRTLGMEDSTTTDEGVEGGDGTPATVEDTTGSSASPAAPSVWEFDDGSSVTREQAYTFAQFDAWLAANPELASQIAGVVQGQYALVPKEASGEQPAERTTAPATPATSTPDDIDMDDPIVRRLWGELTSTRDQLNAASEMLTRHEQQIQQTSANTTSALVNRAATEYAEKHSLNADEMKVLRESAARLNIIGSLLEPFDPITQLPRQVDPVRAVEQALDTAYWAIPEFRQKAIQDMTKEHIKDLRKKSKLTSLGGSSGSMPRQPPAPGTEQERRDAMIREVSAMMNGEQE